MLRLRACSRRLRRGAALGLGPLFVFASCLKTLDESKLDQNKDGGKGGTGADSGLSDVNSDAKDAAKDGKGGTGGGDAPGGGTGGVTDAPVEAGIIPWDSVKYPVTNLASGPGPLVIATDEAWVYRAKKNAASASFYKHPIAGGSGSLLSPLLERPQAMVSQTGPSGYVFVAGGRDADTAGNQGSLVRAPKGGGSKEEIAIGAAVEVAAGIAQGTDGYIYVSFRAVTPAGLALVRVGPSSTTAEKLWNAPSGNETGGDVTQAGDCVYWISNGSVGVAPTAGGNRLEALLTPVVDAVGITSDANNFYFTRADGSVWKRPLLATGCDGSAAPAETQLSSGFKNIGDLVAYDNKVSVSVRGEAVTYKGGGIFAIPVDGGTIIQIGPGDFGPSAIDQGPFDIVFATFDGTNGTIRTVPKNPKQ